MIVQGLGFSQIAINVLQSFIEIELDYQIILQEIDLLTILVQKELRHLSLINDLLVIIGLQVLQTKSNEMVERIKIRLHNLLAKLELKETIDHLHLEQAYQHKLHDQNEINNQMMKITGPFVWTKELYQDQTRQQVWLG